MDSPGPEPDRVPLQRQLTAEYMRMAGGRSNVHGLVEVDVTDARERIRTIEAETGTALSFTAFVVSCLAAAVAERPRVNRYHDWRGRVHQFEDVDVNVLVERAGNGERVGVPHVVRAADRRSVRSIHHEIRRVQSDTSPPDAARFAGLTRRLPGVVRRQMWRLPQLFPTRWKRLAGTVAVTSVGMFGTRNGWAISPTNYTLQLTVGGIGTRPRLIDGELRSREFLSLTVTFDHDVVDGAEAARFVERLGERLEAGAGLDGVSAE
ncbi:2-oxo acid dehydrogenase subunit E2 [Haloarcula onubensis]|uniref:2-oxo acid dehydrogenase subunit E2 n=1 Tax=Haloarcula onubensis TaxID=2950539 RepID=A0ABU2FQN6_9EURY|nr:2-oxo acid dehydrogenase subunit E2 [Halomicroarcula sp. S3CR25-11]MDS0283070.1 2-oxo acid dehydrogenase subunit E2 [Halomicroarcula sp. S3CR25-11]